MIYENQNTNRRRRGATDVAAGTVARAKRGCAASEGAATREARRGGDWETLKVRVSGSPSLRGEGKEVAV
jgi:hypothetical protein